MKNRNDHVVTRTTKTPRPDVLFGFNEKSDFATFRFTGNIIECDCAARGQLKPARPHANPLRQQPRQRQ